MDMDAALKAKKNSKKPQYSRFTQQDLPAWKPILTPGYVIASFLAISIFFIPTGLLSLSASDSVVEVIDRYDQDCVPQDHKKDVQAFIKNPLLEKICNRTMKVPKKMNAPVFVYYQLDNFYQNHRRYVKSRSDQQLHDPKAGDANTKECKPEAVRYVQGTQDPIVPCGLIAWSLFNDTYKFTRGDKVIDVEKKGIAWKSDTDVKFGSDVYPKNFQKGQLIGGGVLDESQPLSKQENLIVWMRTAALPNFRKLYGRINTDLEANENITVVIQNNYNTYVFGGQKKLVLSTASWIGGKNYFIGQSFLVVGIICLIVAVFFILLYVLKPRPLGEPSYLSWNRNPTVR